MNILRSSVFFFFFFFLSFCPLPFLPRQAYVLVNSEQEINISHEQRANILQVRAAIDCIIVVNKFLGVEFTHNRHMYLVF